MWCSLVSPPTSSMGGDRADWFADFLEEKCERRTNQADQDTETKTVDVAEQRALLLQDAVENGGRFLRRRPVAGSARKCGLDVGELLLKVEVERRHVRNKVGLARLRLPRDQRGDRRNADAASDIAHQIKNAGRVAHLFLAERSHGRCGHGHIHGRCAYTADDDWPEQVSRRYLKINVTKCEGRIPKQQATNDDQNTVADVPRDATDNDRRRERTDTEWGHSHTSRERGVVQ